MELLELNKLLSLPIIELKLLVLLIIANGVPILARDLLGEKWGFPLDGGLLFVDGQPLLGRSKTVRGIVCTLVLTGAAAPLLGLAVVQGCLLAALSMLGDLLSSFIKRRLKLRPSSMALGLDQLPESLLPLLVLKVPLGLTWLGILRTVVLFFVFEVVLSRLLFWLKVRKKPY